MAMIQDKLIGFSNVKKGKNSKGGDRAQLYMTTEAAQELSEIIIEKAAAGKGIKLDLHFTVRKNSSTGREFDSAFMFVKEKMDMPAGGFGNGSTQVAVTKDNKAETAAKIEEFKAKQVK